MRLRADLHRQPAFIGSTRKTAITDAPDNYFHPADFLVGSALRDPFQRTILLAAP
jgi:hypothetical protein